MVKNNRSPSRSLGRRKTGHSQPQSTRCQYKSNIANCNSFDKFYYMRIHHSKCNKALVNKQYNAAVKYTERNAYRVSSSNGIFLTFIFGTVGYFLILFVYKITSCIR